MFWPLWGEFYNFHARYGKEKPANMRTGRTFYNVGS